MVCFVIRIDFFGAVRPPTNWRPILPKGSRRSEAVSKRVSKPVGFETAWGAREIRPSDVSKVCLRTEVESDSAAAAHADVCSRKSQSRNAAKAFPLVLYAAFGISTDFGSKPAFASAK